MKACENLNSRSRNRVVCPPHDRSVAGRRSDSLDCAANTALCPVSPRPWSSSWLIAASGVNHSPDSGLPRYSIANTSGARFHEQVRHLSQLCASDKFLGLVLLWNGSLPVSGASHSLSPPASSYRPIPNKWPRWNVSAEIVAECPKPRHGGLMLRDAPRTACVGQRVPAKGGEVRSWRPTLQKEAPSVTSQK